MSNIAWIRTNYQVPAKLRGRVRYTGGKEPRLGVITAADGSYLRIRLDGDKRSRWYHPTWCIEYLPTLNKAAPC
jgi:hypothetical protein